MITKRIMRIMRKTGVFHALVLVFMLTYLVSAPPWARADIPRYINYQGKLTDADDNPVTGDVSITVRLYDVASGGTVLWTETQSVTVTRGVFGILLGNTTVLDDLDFNDAYWYSVEIESDGEMTPRQRLTAVAYAINADKLDGYDAADFLRIDTSGGSTTGITVEGGLITAGANEDIELNPTGTGNIVMAIDSTSGDFKVTDGTTNWLLVDNETGNVTIAKDLTVSGTIYGTLASTGGDSTFSSITVTGVSDLRGNITSGTGAVTIADALTQTGSANQVTFAGNVDANAGLDVTGALTVSGATTLSGALDMNANIDLDYSGDSTALDVNQQGAGAAAIFTGGKVIIGSGTSNAYALSAGELYVQGDMEVDGTIYGNIDTSGSRTFGDTTLSTLTVTGTSDLQGNVDVGAGIDITGTANFAGGTTYKIDSVGAGTFKTLDVTQTDSTLSGIAATAIIQPTYQDGGEDSSTAAIVINVTPTINYTGTTKTGSYTALKIAATETSLPTGSNYLIDAYAGEDGTTQKFYVDNSGNVKIFGALNMNAQRITNVATPTPSSPDSDVATKGYADSITPATAGGWTDGGTGVYLLTASDNVGIGTTSTDTYKLNVAGKTNTTTLYINGTLVSSSDLSDGGSIAMLDADSVITGNWDNTTHPWADDEVVDALTIDGGTIDNTIIGGTTTAAGTFSSLTVSGGDVEIDTSGTDTTLDSITQTDTSDSLAVAVDTSQAGGGAGADSDGVIKLGINEGDYQYIWYDTDAGTDSAGAFVFSDQAVIPSASPAYLNFGMDFNAATKRFGSYYAIKMDPDPDNDLNTNVQTFSVVSIPNPGANWQNSESPLFDVASDGAFNIYDPDTGVAVFQIAAGGKMAHDFRNLIKNASFEAFSIFETFHAADPTAGTTTGGSGYKYEGGWDNFAPDEWTWKKGFVFQYSPEIFEGSGATVDRTTEVREGKSAVSIHDSDTATSDSYPLTGTEASYNDGHIEQTIKNLKPSTWYSIGVAIRVAHSDYCEGIVDITGEDNPTANLTTAIAATGTPSTIVVDSAADFPDAGTLLIDSELFTYTKKSDTEFKNITRAINSTTQASHATGTDNVKSVFRPIISATTDYQTSKGVFKTDSNAANIVVHLISKSTDTTNSPPYIEVRFDTIQIVAGKIVPEFMPSTITDTGDQTIYGTLRMGRTADGRGGILAVDRFVRARGIELFTEDPGFTGTAGGSGGVEPAMVSGSNTGLLTLTTAGNFYGVDPTDFRVWISYDGDPDKFSWEYMRMYPDGTSSGWLAGATDISIDSTWTDSASPLELIDGAKIYFSDGTGGAVNDEWWFCAFGMDPHAGYDSFSGTATYEHGQSRIFKDPWTKSLTFMDAGRKVTLDQIATLVGEPAFVEEPYYNPPATGSGGTLWCTTYGSSYTGTDQRFHEVEIDGDGASGAADTFRWSNGVTDGGEPGGGYWYATGVSITGSAQSLIASDGTNPIDHGVIITFKDSYSGYFDEGVVGDRWTFNAYPGTSGTLSFDSTTAANFRIGDNSTVDQDITLNFRDYNAGTPVDRFIQWKDSTNKFEISNDVNISGTLSADSITGTEPTLTKGNLTESTSSVLTISGGTDAVIGTGTTIQVKQASDTQNGYLSSTDWSTFDSKLDSELDTLATVTGRGATTTNAVTVGNITSGANGADGKLIIYSEQGTTDYTATINPNANMPGNANFYLPADEPATGETYILNMTSGGVIGFDTNTYALTSDLSSYQPLNSGLTSIAGLTTAADKMIYTTALDTYAVTGLTSAGRAILEGADNVAQRTTLGLGSAATRSAEDTLTNGSNLPDGAAVTAYVTGLGYTTASDTLTGLVQSTASGTSYITGGKFGIGMASPTADLNVKGNLSTATAGTLTVANASASVTTSLDLTGHFNVGDAIKIVNSVPSESSVYTVNAIDTTTITLNSTYTGTSDSDGSVTAYKDSDLFLVKDGNDVAMMTLDKSGNLTVEGTINATVEGTSSNANLLDNIDSISFLRSDANDALTTGVTLNIDSGATLSIDGTWDIGDTQVTPTATEINILSGGLSAAELDENLLTSAEGNTAYVNVDGDIMTGNLTMSGADVSVDAGQKLNLEGSTGNTYMSFNSTTNRIEFYVNGEVVAYMRN